MVIIYGLINYSSWLCIYKYIYNKPFYLWGFLSDLVRLAMRGYITPTPCVCISCTTKSAKAEPLHNK